MDLLLKHAEKFGIEGVLDNAIEMGYEVEDLVLLLCKLDTIHETQLNDKRKRVELGLKGVAPKYRRTPTERVEQILIEHEHHIED